MLKIEIERLLFCSPFLLLSLWCNGHEGESSLMKEIKLNICCRVLHTTLVVLILKQVE